MWDRLYAAGWNSLVWLLQHWFPNLQLPFAQLRQGTCASGTFFGNNSTFIWEYGQLSPFMQLFSWKNLHGTSPCVLTGFGGTGTSTPGGGGGTGGMLDDWLLEAAAFFFAFAAFASSIFFCLKASFLRFALLNIGLDFVSLPSSTHGLDFVSLPFPFATFPDSASVFESKMILPVCLIGDVDLPFCEELVAFPLLAPFSTRGFLALGTGCTLSDEGVLGSSIEEAPVDWFLIGLGDRLLFLFSGADSEELRSWLGDLDRDLCFGLDFGGGRSGVSFLTFLTFLSKLSDDAALLSVGHMSFSALVSLISQLAPCSIAQLFACMSLTANELRVRLSLMSSSILLFLCRISSFNFCSPLELVDSADSLSSLTERVSDVDLCSTEAAIPCVNAGELCLAMSIAEVCSSAWTLTELALCLGGELVASSFCTSAACCVAALVLASVCEEVRDACKFAARACEDMFSGRDIENWHALWELRGSFALSVRAAFFVKARG
jgi:hypothetical protein